MRFGGLSLIEKAFQQVIQKTPAEWRGLYSGLIQTQESIVNRVLKKNLLFVPIKTGPLLKKAY